MDNKTIYNHLKAKYSLIYKDICDLTHAKPGTVFAWNKRNTIGDAELELMCIKLGENYWELKNDIQSR